MLKGLREVGAEEVIIRKRDEMAVNPELLDCDYYRFAELDVGAVNAYANEYMSQYYWAEFMINEYEQKIRKGIAGAAPFLNYWITTSSSFRNASMILTIAV